MTFGEKLRKARLDKGMTQAELGKAAHIGVTSIGNYEKGKTYPQNREVYSILARILGIDVNYLRNENEELIIEKQSEELTEEDHKEILQHAAALFAGGKLSEDEQLAFINELQTLYLKAKNIIKERNDEH